MVNTLRRITLNHFRNHHRLSLDLDGRPLAIFGPNGSGKTNILEAISMLSPGRGLRRAASADLARKPDPIGWKILAQFENDTSVTEVETWSETASRLVRIDSKHSPQTALSKISRMVWLIPAMDRLWIEGADGRRRFLDRITMSFIPSHADSVLTYEKAMRERNRLLKDGQTDPSWYSALETQMAKFGCDIQDNRKFALNQLVLAQENAATDFPTADLSLVASENTPSFADEASLKTALSDSRRQDLFAGRTLIGPHRSDLLAIYREKQMPARDCSTGEQKALLVSLILANARALQQEFNITPILLLDEIAAHLDAGRRAALYDEICQTGSQAFMTGTGAELFTELSGRAQMLELAKPVEST